MEHTIDPRTARLVHAVSEKIAGEVVLSPFPGQTLRKWRETFEASQQALAEVMGVSPSVIADYESGRRKSPGVATVKRLVEAMTQYDFRRGGHVIRRLSTAFEVPEVILDIRELPRAVPAQEFVDAIAGKVLAGDTFLDRPLKGYTVLDSIRAVLHLNTADYPKVFGWTTERAIVFSRILYGRSAMVAIRVHPMKPAMVVFHRPKEVDPLALKLAEIERVPLVSTDLGLQELLERLHELDSKVTT